MSPQNVNLFISKHSSQECHAFSKPALTSAHIRYNAVLPARQTYPSPMNSIYFLIEFIDELVFGVGEAAWPLIRNDLGLNYVQIGLALSLPGILGNILEPFIFILGDVWKRRAIILLGGVCFVVSLILTGISAAFYLFMFSLILFNPASGAFVSLSQASLMDSQPARHEQNMARWTFAGSLGVMVGPFMLGGLALMNWGWRPAYWLLALFATLALFAAFKRLPRSQSSSDQLPSPGTFLASLGTALSALKNRTVLRWLILLEFSDLMLDILHGFLALYLVDIMKLSPAEAAFVLAGYTGIGLIGDFLLIPFLERVKGLDYLRMSVLVECILLPLFLLTSIPWLKLTSLGFIGLFVVGWYAILKANLFSSMQGRSGTAQALGSVSGIIGKLIPLGIGLAAQAYGLQTAMWLLLAGPIALLIGLPRRTPDLALNT
jgi:MFS transporter, FSR family, fosmidomycin resistance protein